MKRRIPDFILPSNFFIPYFTDHGPFLKPLIRIGVVCDTG